MSDDKYTPEEIATSAVVETLVDRVKSCGQRFGYFNNLHEVYGIMMEEVCEFFDEVRKNESQRNLDDVQDELLDVACVALRAAIEIEIGKRNKE